MSTGPTLRGMLIVFASACGSATTSPPAQVGPRASVTEPAAAWSEESAAPSRTAEPAALPSCVMHAGLIEVETTKRRGPGGKNIEPIERKSSCFYNAECIRQHGVSNRGDGIVRIHCEDSACVCRIEFLEPSESVHEFSFEALCESGEQAQRLLRERCISARRLPEETGPPKL